jgi:N-acetylmuramoyl-L-alanine amidase CwlA
MAFLTPDKIRTEHGLVIKEKIIPWGAKWTKNYRQYKKGDKYKADRLLSNGTGKVQYVTIHNTTDIEEAKGTNDAEQYTRATYPNQNMGDARVHYFIDETDCWQNLREDEEGWHAADAKGNQTSLGIEIIMDGTGKKADVEAEERGALLAAILLDRHGLGIDKLVTHQYWNGKNCPYYILPHWSEFKAKVEKYLKQIQQPEATFKPYTIKVTAKGALNIRKGAGTNYAITGQIKGDALKYAYTIIEEKDGKGATKWGKLKSGAGWISLDYVKRV